MRPTESELEILQILWKESPISVRAINDELNKTREVGYTTTLKIIQIMFEKGLVDRDASQRSHLYTPLIKEEATKTGLLHDFIKNIYKGSTTELVLSALGNAKTSKDELNQIKELIDKIEHTKKD